MPELQERYSLSDSIRGRLFCHLSFSGGQAPARLSFFLLCRRKSVLWEKVARDQPDAMVREMFYVSRNVTVLSLTNVPTQFWP